MRNTQRIFSLVAISVTAAACLTMALFAQAPKGGKGKGPQPPKLFGSASAAMAAAAAASKQKAGGLTTERLLSLAPYNANLEYRTAVANASQHDTEAEMFYVIDGSGTIVTGGKITGATQNGVNWSGSAIEGGESKDIGKGDFIMVPEKTPHWFSKINGTLVLMSIHLPHPVAGN